MKRKTPWRRWRRARKRAVDRHMRHAKSEAQALRQEEACKYYRDQGCVAIFVLRQTAGLKDKRGLAYRCRYRLIVLGDHGDYPIFSRPPRIEV